MATLRICCAHNLLASHRLRQRFSNYPTEPARFPSAFVWRLPSSRPSTSASYRRKARRDVPTIRAAGGSDQVVPGGNCGGDSSSCAWFSWSQPLLKFVGSNFLPLALVTGVVLGLINPNPGCLAHKYSLSKYCTVGIFLISGLILRSDEIGEAAEAWPAGIFGLASILLFSPFLSKLIIQLQLTPREFITGLAVFCCMPTTLSSGVTLTQLAKGNSALALAMTVASNLLGIITIPFSLSKLIGQGAAVSIPMLPLFKSLMATLLAPLVLGKVLRDTFSSIAKCADQNRKLLSILSAILLSLVPWMQVSRSRSLLLSVNPVMFLKAVTIGMILHLTLLIMNTFGLQSLSSGSIDKETVFKEENVRAVIIVASQKTLPVMVAVVEQLGGVLGESGLLVLPCMAAHITQIVIDSYLVSLWLRKDRRPSKTKH